MSNAISKLRKKSIGNPNRAERLRAKIQQAFQERKEAAKEATKIDLIDTDLGQPIFVQDIGLPRGFVEKNGLIIPKEYR